jgi:hypothetical protein
LLAPSKRTPAGHLELSTWLAVKLQPADDLVNRLAPGADGEADQIQPGAAIWN